MTLGIRKLCVLGLVVSVFVLANALFIAHWLNEVGLVDWACRIRQDFLTGTAITIIIALLILLVPAGRSASAWFRRCPVCDAGISRTAKYCGECGGRV